MARKIDPAITTIMKSYGLDSATALWDCHGTWVMYHRSLEQVAADQNIKFDPPMILEANGNDRSVAICVTGHFKDRSEWSIGEASQHNYRVSGKQAAYPYAMAEKRGKDRVILKLIGLHGLVYSEEEMSADKEQPAPAAEKADLDHTAHATSLIAELRRWKTKSALTGWGASEGIKELIAGLDEANRERVRTAYSAHMETLKEKAAA